MRKSVVTMARIGVAACLVILAAGPTAAGFEKSASFDADVLVVRNLIGETRVRGHAGNTFEVRVQVEGRDASADLIRIESTEGSEASLTVVFPLNETRDFVYPKLGAGSRSSFSLDQETEGWLSSLLGGLLGRKITVRGRGDGLQVWADVEILVPRGAELRVRHGVGDLTAEDVEGAVDLDTSTGKVRVHRVTGALRVDTGSGSVEVSDVNGAIDIDTGSGKVELSRGRGESVLIDTGSGSVEVDQVDSPSLIIDTGSGKVRATAITTDRASIDTGSGSVVLSLARMGNGDFEIDTGSGSITLELPSGAGADVRAETGSGGIDVDLAAGAQYRYREKDEVALTVGGGGPQVELSTGSGGIRIRDSY